MRDLSALLERIRQAEKPDRELFRNVAYALLGVSEVKCSDAFWRFIAAEAWEQAALALCERALPGWGYFIRRDEDGCNAALLYPYASRVTPGSRQHPTSPALALLAALVAAEMEENPNV